MKRLDLILIDSFQDSYYQYCPFLSRLKEENSHADLLPIVGYQQQLASLFSGCWPREIEVWNTFILSPERSIFKWTKFISPLKFLDRTYPKYLIDFFSYFFAGVGDMLAAQIPLKIMAKFDILLRQPITARNCLNRPTIFDLFRQDKVSFAYFKGGLKYTDRSQNFLANLRHLTHRSDKYTLQMALKDYSDFKFIYLMGLDAVVHHYGLNSPQVKKKLEEIDALLEFYLKKSQRPFVIISDHGMVEVKKTIDLAGQIESLGLVLGEDYLVFYESVLARFWFFNKEAEKKIIDQLKRIKEGRVTEKEEQRKLGIDFKNNQFGDLFFILDPGYLILPNYYQTKVGIKAMHGYLSQFNKGIFLTNGKVELKPNEDINFIEVAGIISRFFRINS